MHTARVPCFVLLAALFALAGCSSAPAASGETGSPCDSPSDCEGGACVEGFCSESPPPFETPDAGVDTGPGDAAADAFDVPDLLGFGEPCESNDACMSGFCITPRRGADRFCTELCFDECARDGFECALIENFGGDRVFLCVPEEDRSCEPCEEDLDCGGLDDLCVDLEGGSYCATGCDEAGDCAPGFDCITEDRGDNTLPVCVPESRVCEGCLDPDGDGYGVGVDCPGGDCNEGRVDVNEGAVEVCDGADNDCDLDIDEGFDFASDNANCGRCGVVCDLADGESSCVDGECVLEACVEGFNDCDGDASNGCERADEELNACGGCEALEAEPGAECGPCGLDALVCDGTDALVCDGETTANACGGCDELRADPGDECGPCGLDALVCDGAEALACDGDTTANACGGCEELDGAIGDACGPCGLDELVCDGSEALACGSETPSNDCGGCSELAHVLGSACGPCLDGSWECAGTDDLSCDDPGEAASCARLGAARFGWSSFEMSGGVTVRGNALSDRVGRATSEEEENMTPFPGDAGSP